MHESSSPSDMSESDVKESKEDFQFNYHKAKMRMGLLLADINDSIREGDGTRLINLYSTALHCSCINAMAM